MKRIFRSKVDSKIAGVCGGIGETFDIDPTIVRLAFVFIGIITGIVPILIAYMIGWIIIPEKPEI